MDGTSNGTKNGRKTKAQLQEELDKTREERDEARELCKEQERELTEYQQRQQKAETTIESLQEKLAKYETEKAQTEETQEDISEEPEDVTLEDISASKATFRIDLYPRQGHYQGKIEHLLTKQKRAFSGLDQDVIMDFISSHLPQVDKQSPSSEAMTRLDVNIPTKIVPHDQPFQILLTLDLSNIAESDMPLGYEASVYAKPLIGARQIIGKVHNIITAPEVVSLDMTARIPQAGTYCIEAVLTSSVSEGIPAPYTDFVENGLLQVY